eukprot:comp17155_c0_seq1/m.15981 comp17155_c0_seq1/g.15981  ORF comp17155_c0_seq1/g.15981 comp17155_c0_seq1/m.15981 type:complete len:132 (-) comp17155_c0_seq1:505-900(-)
MKFASIGALALAAVAIALPLARIDSEGLVAANEHTNQPVLKAPLDGDLDIDEEFKLWRSAKERRQADRAEREVTLKAPDAELEGPVNAKEFIDDTDPEEDVDLADEGDKDFALGQAPADEQEEPEPEPMPM